MGPCSNSEGRDAPFLILAGAEGFEPPQAGSEPAVLPLDDAPTLRTSAHPRLKPTAIIPFAREACQTPGRGSRRARRRKYRAMDVASESLQKTIARAYSDGSQTPDRALRDAVERTIA